MITLETKKIFLTDPGVNCNLEPQFYSSKRVDIICGSNMAPGTKDQIVLMLIQAPDIKKTHSPAQPQTLSLLSPLTMRVRKGSKF